MLAPFQKRISSATMIALLGLMTANLWGQSQSPTSPSTPAIQAKQEVVEVTTESVPIEATSASVVVLTRTYIDNSHAVSAADLLATVPFLHVAQNGSAGSPTNASLRGGKAHLTVV